MWAGAINVLFHGGTMSCLVVYSVAWYVRCVCVSRRLEARTQGILNRHFCLLSACEKFVFVGKSFLIGHGWHLRHSSKMNG